MDEIIKYVTPISVVAGGLWALLQYQNRRRLDKFDLFIKYREKLKTNPSTLKIINHIQDWQLDPAQKDKIDSRGISINDFYYTLGFFEEISLLNQDCLISNKLVTEMFGFYACELANNEHYWKRFGEDYSTDDGWKNFKKLIAKCCKNKHANSVVSN